MDQFKLHQLYLPLPGKVYVQRGSGWQLVTAYPIPIARQLRFVPEPSPYEVYAPWTQEYPFLGEWKDYVVPFVIEVTTAHRPDDLIANGIPVVMYSGGGMHRIAYQRGASNFAVVEPSYAGVVEIDLLGGGEMEYILDVVAFGLLVSVYGG